MTKAEAIRATLDLRASRADQVTDKWCVKMIAGWGRA